MAGRFEARLREGPPIVADGGMGSLLTAAVPRLRSPEEANLRAPEAVVSLHVSFIEAGAELIETNTFGANRHKLAAHYLEGDFEQINSTGVKLAREAREISGRDVFIAAAIGPLGDFEQRREAPAELFAEQARILEGRGADLIMLETFYDLSELELAIAGGPFVSELPIVALMSFDSDAQTLGGVTAGQAAQRLGELAVAAFGANHGRGPAAALTALAEMQIDGAILAALPNVGLATMTGTRVTFPLATPEYFGEFAARARSLGAGLIGGCCGTTPTQIAAIRAAIDEGREASSSIRLSDRVATARPVTVEAPTELARLLAAGEFVVSVQLDPPLGGNAEALVDAARKLKEAGVAHVVDVNDNPRARARMNGLIASVAIEQRAGIETVPHLTPRDSTIAGLESLLLGAHAQGIRNVLAVTGDPPEAGDYPGTGAVYDIDAIGLVELLTRFNEGEDYHRRSIDAPTAFFPGVAVNPTATDLDLEIDRFERKVAAGARFAMTQILFDLGYLERFLERLGGSSPVPLLVGVWPIRSYELAVRVHNETPGIVVPPDVQDRYRSAGTRGAEVGVKLAHELIAGARELAAGVYIVAPFRQPLGVLDVLS